MHMMLPYNNLNLPIQIPPGFQLVSQAGQLSDASILSNLQQQMNIQQQQNQNAEKLRSDFIRERKRPFPDPGAYSDAGSEEFNEMKKLHSDFGMWHFLKQWIPPLLCDIQKQIYRFSHWKFMPKGYSIGIHYSIQSMIILPVIF